MRSNSCSISPRPGRAPWLAAIVALAWLAMVLGGATRASAGPASAAQVTARPGADVIAGATSLSAADLLHAVAARWQTPLLYLLAFAVTVCAVYIRLAERELKKLTFIASRTDHAVMITGSDGRIEWVNAAFTRMSGYALREVIGRRPGRLLQGADTDPRTVAYMRERLSAGQGFQVEIVNYAKTGRQYWVQIDVEPIRSRLGRIRHFIAIEADVTARKAMEQALREAEERYRGLFANAALGTPDAPAAGI